MISPKHLTAPVLAFVCAVTIALCFAAYTNHVWEDYYITYRSSKNLATGHGLVYNHGDRLHTFTSPLGVLLPAAASLLTANSSDTGALWLFRLMSAAAFAGAVGLLFRTTRRLGYSVLAAGFLAAALCVDVKSVDFTINGMETAFMLLFLAYTFWAHLTPGARRPLHLGAAWAGLMWTRPDSFIYIGLLAAGVWLFNDPARTGENRRSLLGLFFKAGLVAAALYLPWILWSWWYYGSPIPHTIVAKAWQGDLVPVGRLKGGFWRLPYLVWQGQTAVDSAFLPAYHMFPSWPAWAQPWSRMIGTVACVLWLVPGMRMETRVASLAFYGAQTYLSFVPYFPFPWYLPSTTILAFIALAGLFARLADAAARLRAHPVWAGVILWSARILATVVVAGGVTLLFMAARQLKAQQDYIETGNRRRIGEWLHEHAKPGDTVFMEPLGYIGYFSGLKTYDWPGMSSREVVEATGLVGNNWGDIISFLQPDWVITRPLGEGDLAKISPALGTINYEFVKEFSQFEEVRKLEVHGRRYLEFDALFWLYRRKNPTRHDADGVRIASPIGSSIRRVDNLDVRLVHAPGFMIMPVPPDARTVEGFFGFPPEVIEEQTRTDGVRFVIWWCEGKKRTPLLAQTLRPYEEPESRKLIPYKLDLPARGRGQAGQLVFETQPLASINFDWSCWSPPEFH